jgi:hypothetical protein
MEKMVSPRINHSQFTKNGGHKQSKIGGFLLGLPVCHISWKTLGLKKRTPHTLSARSGVEAGSALRDRREPCQPWKLVDEIMNHSFP